MRVFTAFSLAVLCAPSTRAQQPTVSPEWDVRKTLTAIEEHVNRLIPILEQIRPKDWVAQGAPDTYINQLNTSISQAKSLANDARKLNQRPDKLADAMQVLFRMQTIDSSLASVLEGLRKYQNPALADLIVGVQSEGTANRDKFRQYVLDLATEKEQQFEVADREAQRCRESISKQPTHRPR